MDILSDKNVAVFKTKNAVYPTCKPYHPSEKYPEIKYVNISQEKNYAFDAIRNALKLYELDILNFDNPKWNPLGSIIKPNNIVLIKPNLVSHFNWGYKSGLTDTDSLITHGSVIRAVIDYVIIALEGRGKIIIGDSPVQLSSWGDLMTMIGFIEMKAFFGTLFPQIKLESVDFRLGFAKRNKSGVIERVEELHDENRYVETDLGLCSLLTAITQLNTSFGVVDYSKVRLKKTHNTFNHKYLFPKLVIDADVLINLPKLKTHSKAGITCSLKNLVGINSHKDYLPHFRFGSPLNGGDEYPEKGILFKLINDVSHQVWELDPGVVKNSLSYLLKVLKFTYLFSTRNKRQIFNITGGGWYGNDTLWRTILDINRVFFYLGKNYKVNTNHIQFKKYFSLVDGLIGGEKLSPLLPTPVSSGFIIAGGNPVAIDTVAASLIGFDYRKLHLINDAYHLSEFPLVNFLPDDIQIKSNFNCSTIEDMIGVHDSIKFEPSIGYKGHIEI